MSVSNKISASKYLDSPTHPGITLRETLDEIGMSQVELAKRMQRPEQTISTILNSQKAITPDTAIQLEKVLGIPSTFWNNLQKNYEENTAYLQEKENLEQEIDHAKAYPYSELVKLGWVPPTLNIEEKVKNLLSFFAVSSLKSLPDLGYTNYRKIKGKTVSSEAIAAWLRRGEIEAQAISTKDIDLTRCKDLIPLFRSLTVKSPTVFHQELVSNLASCGISFVVIPHLKNTYVCGATKWISPNKALLQLNLLGQWSDRFWFNFFHELGHILLHSKKDRYVDLKQANESELENEANAFASDVLIPRDQYTNYVKQGAFDTTSIVTFANSVGIHPGIVLGRLQHDDKVGYDHLRSLKDKYIFK